MQMCSSQLSTRRAEGESGGLPKKSEMGRSILKVRPHAPPGAAATPQVRAGHSCTSNNPEIFQ